MENAMRTGTTSHTLHCRQELSFSLYSTFPLFTFINNKYNCIKNSGIAEVVSPHIIEEHIILICVAL